MGKNHCGSTVRFAIEMGDIHVITTNRSQRGSEC